MEVAAAAAKAEAIGGKTEREKAARSTSTPRTSSARGPVRHGDKDTALLVLEQLAAAAVEPETLEQKGAAALGRPHT